MNKIYTKTGDAGQTSLLTGERVYKDCLVLKVVGELDELNAVLGLSVIALEKSLDYDFLISIQKDLFKIGAEIASAQMKNNRAVKIGDEDFSELVGNKEIEELEKEIDKMWAQMPELSNFILPGGCEASVRLHLARTICRRAERELIVLQKEREIRNEVGKYLNRLSDYLFCLARFVNFKNGVGEITI